MLEFTAGWKESTQSGQTPQKIPPQAGMLRSLDKLPVHLPDGNLHWFPGGRVDLQSPRMQETPGAQVSVSVQRPWDTLVGTRSEVWCPRGWTTGG